MDLEARAHSEHPEELRLWLRLLACTNLVEAPLRGAQTSHPFPAEVAAERLKQYIRTDHIGFHRQPSLNPIRSACLHHLRGLPLNDQVV